MQKNNDIIHINDINTELTHIFKKYEKEKIFLLTDSNCNKYCLPLLSENFLEKADIIKIKNGESSKNIETLQFVWDFLIKHNASRNSLLINLGGGVITDIGGFAASTYKRGMNFINIPTSLLAQVDASIGGKTGINYNGLKNEIGVINLPEKVIISSSFLKTLKKTELLSGFAEMIKHSLIYDKTHYYELKEFYFNDFKTGEIEKINNLIAKSVKIKEHFIKNDIDDKGIRQILNFGHTFGHALESYFIENEKTTLKHGYAVAYGMICELYISVKKLKFPEHDFNDIYTFILGVFGKISIKPENFEVFFQYMKHDKKNNFGEINCVLIDEFNKASTGNKISKEDMIEALNFLNKK
ncbi:MAG: 3-dehydroquinate synthase [Bacteroidales bacterium]|nr:3-dehydroquinate synthase [Bacteroidales bacterium]